MLAHWELVVRLFIAAAASEASSGAERETSGVGGGAAHAHVGVRRPRAFSWFVSGPYGFAGVIGPGPSFSIPRAALAAQGRFPESVFSAAGSILLRGDCGSRPDHCGKVFGTVAAIGLAVFSGPPAAAIRAVLPFVDLEPPGGPNDSPTYFGGDV